MFNVSFYQFSKKQNSTKRPSNGANFQCIIRNDSSIVNPIIEIKFPNPTEFNYCYIQEFNRYYFITNWTWVSGLWVANLTVDVLATLKDEIGSNNFYILRSSASSDGDIVDTLFPSDSSFTFNRQIGDFNYLPSPVTMADGMFVCGIVSKNPRFGSLVYYGFDYEGMASLLNYLLNDNFYTTENGFNPDDFGISLQKSIVDPFQYIRSCVWIPIRSMLTGLWQETTTIYSWTIPVRSYPILFPFSYRNYSFENLLRHPQASTRGNYCNLAPFTEVSLYMPPFGMIPLDTTQFSKTNSVDLKFVLDCLNGLGRLIISMNGNVCHNLNAQIGVPIELSQVQNGGSGAVLKTLMGAVATGAGVALGMGSVAMFGAEMVSDGIGNGLNALMGGGHLQSNGGNGSFADLVDGTPYLYYQFAHLLDDDNAKMGRPLCKIRKPSDLGGYMTIQKADFETDAVTSNELEACKALMEGGFYYE